MTWRTALAGLALAFSSWAQSVEARDGNLYLTIDGQRRQLTATGRDSSPNLSADKTTIVFLRKHVGGSEEPSDIEVLQIKNATTKVALSPPIALDGRQFSDFTAPQFGSDDAHVYFLVGDYGATTAGVFMLDLATGRTTYVTTGLQLIVVQRGKFAGDLIVYQGRPKLGVGYYFWFYLLTPLGKDVGVIGQDQKDVAFFMDKYADLE